MNQLNETREYKQIGKRIRHYRDLADMTQQQLATAVGFGSQTAIQYIEMGKRRLRVVELKQLARVLGIKVDQLLTDHTQVIEVAREKELTFDDDSSKLPRIETHLKYDKEGRLKIEDNSTLPQ